VEKIFRDFVDGKGLYPIARELNAMGVTTHRGNPFENRTVEYILRNPVYIGKLRWNPSGKTRRDFTNENIIVADSDHQRLISDELWQAAQERMDAVKAQWGYKARPTTDLKHWLSGLVRCGACGGTLIFTAPRYFKCGNYAKGRCTHSQHTPSDVLVQAVIAQLEADVHTSGGLTYDVTYTSHGGDLPRLEAAERQIQQKKARLQDAYLSGVLDLADFAQAKKALDQDAAEVAEQIKRLHGQTDEAAIRRTLQSAIAEALATITSPDSTTQQKHTAARSVIDVITYDKPTAHLTLTYRILL
jgi:hypothetical protein